MRKKVLVADDDAGILEVITLVLTQEGYDVIPVSEGGSVHREVQRTVPDVILLDIWMSGYNGGDILSQLKRKEETKHIPVILVSANTKAAEIAKTSGADDFLAKPFDIQDLAALVKKYIVS